MTQEYELLISCKSNLSAEAVGACVRDAFRSAALPDPMAVQMSESLGVNGRELVISVVVSLSMSIAGNFATEGIREAIQEKSQNEIVITDVQCTQIDGEIDQATPSGSGED